jgi:DNA-binding transcriptional ArsR family regulator
MAHVDRLLLALGDPTRRSIFERVNARAQAVGEVARGLPVSRPAVSQHLKVLKAAGLVADERRGNRRIYSVDPAGIGALRAYLDRFGQGALNETRVPAATTKPRVTLKPVVRRADAH